MRLIDKAHVLANKYNYKYNGDGITPEGEDAVVSYEAVELDGSRDLKSQKESFARWVKMRVDRMSECDPSVVIFLVYSDAQDPSRDRAVSLILDQKDYCFISDDRNVEPNVVDELKGEGLNVVPILSPLKNMVTEKESFIQKEGRTGSLALAGNVAKYIANQTDCRMKNGVRKMDEAEFEVNDIVQSLRCGYRFDFQATDPSGELLQNILKYSQNPKFESDLLSLNNLSGEFLTRRFSPNLGIRSDILEIVKPRTSFHQYLNKKENCSRMGEKRHSLQQKEDRIGREWDI